MTISATQLIDAYVTLRDKLAEEKKEWSKKEAEYKAKLDKINNALLAKMNEVGTTQLKSESGKGVAYRQKDSKFSCADWPSYWKFISANNRFDMLHKRIGEDAVKKYYEEAGEYPPGINHFDEYKIVVRQS